MQNVFSCTPFGEQSFKEIAHLKYATKLSHIAILHTGQRFKALLLQCLHLSLQSSLHYICITEGLIHMILLK